jgi:glycosyltransferase involved in cell wall biosynthesis
MSHENQEDVTIIIPVYNEEEVITKVLESWLLVLRKLKIKFSILALNDGSKDGTLSVLQRVAEENPELTVIDKTNSGHGPTILEGYRKATTQWIFQVDSDNEIDADQFPAIWNSRAENDLVLGVRYQRQSPLSRQLITFVSRLTINLLYGKGVTDVNTPFRLYKRIKFQKIFSDIPPDTFAPNVILSGYAAVHRMNIAEVNIDCHPRLTGEVSIKKWKLAKAAMKAFSQTIKFRFSRKFSSA